VEAEAVKGRKKEKGLNFLLKLRYGEQEGCLASGSTFFVDASFDWLEINVW